ncbi:hypothetical protein ACFQGT_16710 [Natrialbaceae archaeon GCM10025810]|uniref:hypothetical protein n=1 Tax=Halovalidus salilacus TaxID=3075124 RepID=UPI00361434A7
MSDRAADGRTTASGSAPAITVDGLATYLRCPRRYEFAHVHGLEGKDESPTEARVDLVRRAICDALRTGETGADALEEAARDRLGTLWADHDERFHSLAQRRHERRVLEATVSAYVEAAGADHASGLEALRADAPGGTHVGPNRRVSSTIRLPENDGGGPDLGPEAVTIDASIDYAYANGSELVGVRLEPTLAGLGPIRYRSSWEGAVEELFDEHFDPADDRFEPGPVAALFETSVVLDGLRTLRDRLDLEGRTCRYLRIPLAERSRTSINWVRGTVETSLEPVDVTDAFVDHHAFGMTHERRNPAVRERLARVVRRIVAERFDPTEPAGRWDRVSDRACPNCEYTVCCGEYVAEEVRFDG